MIDAPRPPLSVFAIGTRAQLIKLAPVIAECERRSLPAVILMTGQHKETMQDLLSEFQIRSLQVNAVQSAEHATVFSLFVWLPAAISGIQGCIRSLSMEHPELRVIVHGDTLSTLASAFAARRCGANVVHLESGLTSGRLFNPFPEEIARRLVFRLAHVAMCPDRGSADHIRQRFGCSVVETEGNTIVDAVSLVDLGAGRVEAASPYVVASLHRFQNIYSRKRLRQLVAMLVSVSEHYVVYFVLHPATKKRLVKYDLLERLQNAPGVKLSPRLGYGAFLRLVAGADCVLTDGGSNQEELAVLGIPTIVMRQTTERSDGLGKNAIMEHELDEGVESYLSSGTFEILRSPGLRQEGKGPSSRVVDYLAQPAGQ